MLGGIGKPEISTTQDSPVARLRLAGSHAERDDAVTRRRISILPNTVSVREIFDVERARLTVHNWVHKANPQRDVGRCPDYVAVEETVIRLTDCRCRKQDTHRPLSMASLPEDMPRGQMKYPVVTRVSSASFRAGGVLTNTRDCDDACVG